MVYLVEQLLEQFSAGYICTVTYGTLCLNIMYIGSLQNAKLICEPNSSKYTTILALYNAYNSKGKGKLINISTVV